MVGGISTAGLSPNDIAVLGALNGDGTPGHTLLTLIGTLTPGQQKQALDSLSGQNATVNLLLALDAPQVFITDIESHILLGAAGGGGSQYASAGIADGQVAQGNGLLGNQGAIYGGWRSDPWYATGLASVGWNDYQTNRNVFLFGPASATFGGQAYSVYGEGGYITQLLDVTVTPYFGLGYVHAHTGAFTETGGGGTALSVNAAGCARPGSTNSPTRITASLQPLSPHHRRPSP